MSRLRTLKNHYQESAIYRQRAIVAMIMILLATAVLIGRLIFLQVFAFDIYKTLSLHNQVRIVPLVPSRGLIFDRHGVVIAENIPAFSLEITPERVANLEETLQIIDTIIPLTHTERQRFYRQLKHNRRSEPIPLRLKLSEEEVAKFSVEKYRLTGVDIHARLIRYYPFKDLFAHALGYVGPINEKEVSTLDPINYRGSYIMGKTGLEKFYEKTLHGIVGYQHVETDAKGRTIRVLDQVLPIPGRHLHLSLDTHLQQAAVNAMQDLKGAIVAIEPETGSVLALVSTPSFDPNLFSHGIDSKNYDELRNAIDKPLFNRAIQAQYPPGSTIKPLVALKGLDLGTITPALTIFDPGWYQLQKGGRLYRDWIYHAKKQGHGSVDLEKAIAQSCDTYFFTLAHKLGLGPLQDIYRRFGLGKNTQIDSAGEASGLLPSEEWKQKMRQQAWYPGDTLNIGIGQGALLATPLQMAQVSSMLANRGKTYEPRLVYAIEQTDLTTLENPPRVRSGLYPSTAKHWQTIIHAMQQVVHAPGSTAYRISQGLRYPIAGKTGTSQVFNLKQNEKYVASKLKAHLRDHSWFIAFAPVDNPRIAIAVLIENKQQKSAADIARIVLDAFFNVENTPQHPHTPSLNNGGPPTLDSDEEETVGFDGESDAP